MKTIRQQLTRSLLLGASLLLVIGALVVYVTTRTALTRQFDDALRTKTTALASIVEQEDGKIGVDSTDEIMRDFEGKSRGAFFQVWREDGRVAAVSPSLQGGSLPLTQTNFDQPLYWNLKLPTGLEVRATTLKFQPHPANDANQPTAPVEAILVVAADRHNLDQALATLALVLTGSSLLALVLTGVFVPRLLRRELAPLDELAAQAQRITAESLAQRFATDGLPGELAPISSRLNDLLQRLETAFARERQFSDDLAHEFRTPIAELRSLAELALKWPDNRSGDADRNVLAIAMQMENIVNRLLAIARSDMGLMDIEAQPVELKSLVSTICTPLERRRADRRLSFQISFPTALEIESDPTLLRSIVTNLLDNAVEYSKPGSSVEINGESQNGNFTLAVTNAVQQLNAEDVPHLFERFWRKDAARSGGEHSGLGLALARAFAASLGYILTATLNDDARLTMRLSGSTRTKHPAKSVQIQN
jgi:two-component system sensor histidine kinase QseC